MIEPKTRAEAEELMRDPRYWRDRDPQLIEAVHRAFQRRPGATAPVQRDGATYSGKGAVSGGNRTIGGRGRR